MYYQSLIIPAMIITIYCHTPKNDSDVIVTYEEHAEAVRPAPILTTSVPDTKTEIRYQRKSTTDVSTTMVFEETENVVFIPNEPSRNENNDNYENNKISVKDILNNGNTINDVLNNKRVRVETETPKEDILFISGRNDEKEETFTPKEIESNRRSNVKKEKKMKLDCSNLDCNNTLNSVCGGKIEHSQWRYRLFLNECFFRKVNCNFKYEENRFKRVKVEMCKPVAAHYSEKPFSYKSPRVQAYKPTQATRPTPSFYSRRSMNVDLDGKFCSHPCPAYCSEQYEPECAVSNHGQRKVFMNHCKLDFNSCSYGSVWQRRPLAECVGGKKADLTRNSAFIGWMQRVGIVDNKGRLTLE